MTVVRVGSAWKPLATPVANRAQNQKHATSVLFQGHASSLNQTIQAIDPNLRVARATVADKPDILTFLKAFYLGEVNPASAKEPGYENQGDKIMMGHEGVIDANLQQVASDPRTLLHVVTDTRTGQVVATAALLKSALNGTHVPPASAGQVSYFYKAPHLPDSVSRALIDDIARTAKAQQMTSLYTTARRKGMDDRNRLMQAMGFQEVTDSSRVAILAPPRLQGERNVVYEKPLI